MMEIMANTPNALTDDKWAELRAGAIAAAAKSRAPYSKLHVGAAALLQNGNVVSGCNVENASYGLTLCAECGIVSAAAIDGGGMLIALAVVDGEGNPLAPCGRCRQILHEAGGPELLVDTEVGPVRIADMLPGAFTATDLP